MAEPYRTVTVDTRERIAYVNLNRPEVRNAFNEEMIADLTYAFAQLGKNQELRAIVLGGNGLVFCAGADVEWMRRSSDRSESENLDDARAMAMMFRAIDECPVPVVGRVQRAAMGGGLGLVAVCDIVVAVRTCALSFSEVRLGIIPSVISTFVLNKIGEAQARRFFLTGEVFTAEQAPPGLVHISVDEGPLDSLVDLNKAIERITDALQQVGPQAARQAKQLIFTLRRIPSTEALEHCVQTIARIRTTTEAQEGLRAFLEKREPSWRAKHP